MGIAWVFVLFIASGFRAVSSFLKFIWLRIYQPIAEYWLELTLGVSEEVTKSVVRESFNHLIRFINGFFAWLVSLSDKISRLFARSTAATPAFVRMHWEELRPSTFNCIVKREAQSDETQSTAPGAAASSQGSVSARDSLFRSYWVKFVGWLKRQWGKQPSRTAVLQPLLERHFVSHLWSGWRHRGWVEDAHLAFEMRISEIFNLSRKVMKLLLLLPQQQTAQDPAPAMPSEAQEQIEPMHDSTLSGRARKDTGRLDRALSMPSLHSQKRRSGEGLITAEHFISEAGYPQELHTVTTDDGYILLLHRVPRPNARRTVFFQHGVLDTSLGWVCGNATDSLAFAAWDEGCDVWLGNSRSNPPRRHIDPNIATDKYWSYTLNELGMKDVGAQLEYIHAIKCQELQEMIPGVQESSREHIHLSKSEGYLRGDAFDPPFDDETNGDGSDASMPYSLTIVGHSLGAAALLIYLVTSLHCGRRHHARRLILMSPAGFHPVYPPVVLPLKWLLPPVTWLMEKLLRRRGAALMIPGSFGRLFFFKIFQDAVQYPAIKEFVKRSIRFLMNGDVSPWEFAMQLPHYNVKSMPGISVHSGIHLIQLVRSGRFRLFDYGSDIENMVHYGQSTPIDIAEAYGKIDIPVDIVAGRNDGVIPPECVQLHVRHMLDRGVDVSYREFDYGHLEFSATVGHDLQSYILERIA